MHDRFGDPDLSVSDLAQAAGLSQFYFMRSFLNATGMTAHSYLVQLRLNAARGRLAAGAQAAAVAVECGFFD
jgi:AraC-like DNA-binding protein